MQVFIEETTDYDQFNKHKANREINEKLVTKLVKAIDKKNLLKCKPIIVDQKFNVIDGQHRLEAAKRLGLPISYVKDFSVDIEDMETFNNNKKSWQLPDYLDHHCNQEKIHYQALADFIKRENVQLNIALKLLHGCQNQKFIDEFKSGEYRFPGKDVETDAVIKKKQITEVINFIKLKTSGPKTYLDKVTFYSAMVEFFNIPSFTFEIFMQKLHYKIDLVHCCTRQIEYVKLFKNIYNFKNQSPIE